MPSVLEIACFSEKAVDIASAAGAQRIELCEDYNVGGITPGYELIKKVRASCALPLHVIIRPRAGNFVYSDTEIETIKHSVQFCKQTGIDGIVFGALNPQQQPDLELCKCVVQLSGTIPVTFHRAIDACLNMEASIESLIEIGIKRVLTSGGKQQAEAGAPLLKKLQWRYGQKIIIMPGGGVRSSNLQKILKQTSCTEVHSAAITDTSELPDHLEIKKLLSILNSKWA